MGYKHLNYSESQIEELKKYYPNQDWEQLFQIFPDLSQKQITKIAYQYHIKSNNPHHIKDMSGKKYGELFVQSLAYTKNNQAYWNCTCSCGKKCIVLGTYLRNKTTTSCGHLQYVKGDIRVDKTGNRYGKLIVQKMIPNYFGEGKHGCLCKCDCGNEKIIYTGRLGKAAYTKTCGSCNKDVKKYDKKHEKRLDRNDCIYIIYKHTAPNGYCYIGMTKRRIEKRSGYAGEGYASQRKFNNAIKKYGWENFSHEILESQLTHSEACEKERYYIDYFDSINKGYNTLPGGSGLGKNGKRVYQLSKTMNILNIFHSESEAATYLKPITHKTIAKWCLSDELINGYYWVFEDDYPDAIDDSLYKEINLDYLQFDPYEYLHEINHANAKKRAEKSAINHRRKINQYTLDGKYLKTYNSIADTYQEYGTTVFSAVRYGGTAYGYQWKYYEGTIEDIPPTNVGNQIRIYKIHPDTHEIIEEYSTMSKAWRTNGLNFYELRDACDNNTLLHGYYWQRVGSRNRKGKK